MCDCNKTNFFGQDRAEILAELRSSQLFGSEGSGDQKKIWLDNRLHKLNSKFHEDDKEVAASKIGKAFGLNCVQYHSARYKVSGKVFRGCYCQSYLAVNEESVSFAYIFQQSVFDVPMKMSAVDFFCKTINTVSEFTGIPKDTLRTYLMNILVFDFIICNPDRHFTNLEVIYNHTTFTYRLPPIYDCGQAFLRRSVMPPRDILDSELHKFKTKPFSTNPKRNIINISSARSLAQQFFYNAGGIKGINELDINDYFKYIILRRYHELMGYSEG